MKKVISKVEYNTETAEVVAKHTVGLFGDAAGYEETLMKTENGKYFVYENGGAESIHPVEAINRIAANKVDAWKAERGL